MRIALLLSSGRHPISGRSCAVPVELQAVRLAGLLGGEVTGFHAGPDASAASDAFGHGLGTLVHLPILEEHDPLAALVEALDEEQHELVLCGRRGQGGEDSGLLPYVLAQRLGRPIIADAAALEMGGEPGTLVVEQVLPKGARRRVTVRLPAVVSVHPAAPAPHPFAFGAARRGVLEVRSGASGEPWPARIEERAYRPRPKLIAKAAAGASAADRLRAATESASSGGRVMVNPAPEDAAREILAYLREIGVFKA